MLPHSVLVAASRGVDVTPDKVFRKYTEVCRTLLAIHWQSPLLHTLAEAVVFTLTQRKLTLSLALLHIALHPATGSSHLSLDFALAGVFSLCMAQMDSGPKCSGVPNESISSLCG